MFTVALIGPDGAGKTTVGRKLIESFPLPITYLYMGVNDASSNRMLPTTRLARRIKKALRKPSDTRGPRDPRTIVEPRITGGAGRSSSSTGTIFRTTTPTTFRRRMGTGRWPERFTAICSTALTRDRIS
jgi:hypothetical protein